MAWYDFVLGGVLIVLALVIIAVVLLFIISLSVSIISNFIIKHKTKVKQIEISSLSEITKSSEMLHITPELLVNQTQIDLYDEYKLLINKEKTTRRN